MVMGPWLHTPAEQRPPTPCLLRIDPLKIKPALVNPPRSRSLLRLARPSSASPSAISWPRRAPLRKSSRMNDWPAWPRSGSCSTGRECAAVLLHVVMPRVCLLGAGLSAVMGGWAATYNVEITRYRLFWFSILFCLALLPLSLLRFPICFRCSRAPIGCRRTTTTH